MPLTEPPELDTWVHKGGRLILIGDAAHCASPLSGMGTTLALSGAYNLAGSLVQHPENIDAAFAQYEEKQRPLVQHAQVLPLGGKSLEWFYPETAWGIWTMHVILAFIQKSGLAMLMFKYFGPGAEKVRVEEYGLKQLDEWKGYKGAENLR